MAVRETAELDFELVDRLIAEEEARLEEKHERSVGYHADASRSLAGGVASSWQNAPPHAVYISHGEGSKIWDIDGNEYVDYHLGYGVMVVGHAHPKVVEAVRRRIALGSHFAQPTEDAVVVAEALADRFGLPLWRFGNSGTEATLDAVRLMRATTGRDLIVKIEGTYHGHHDSLMVSVVPDPKLIGERHHPVQVPQTRGLPKTFVDLVRVIPFNDLDAVQRVLSENEGRVAGMIVEPAMMNAGIILPEPGYLQGVRDITRKHGVMLTFDEVKTGCTVAYGGAVEAFGVTPDFVCLAKAIGGGLPCGAIGGTEESMGPIVRQEVDQQGTFNGNPLTMAAARVTLTEILARDAYRRFDEINGVLVGGCEAVIESYGLPAYVTALGAKGSVTHSATRVREYRDTIPIDERITYLAWLWQQNRGVFKSPWAKQETWTTSVAHSDEDAKRYVANFEELAAALTS